MDAVTTAGPTAGTASTWQVRWHPAPDARLRLFCLPHAGGGALPYRSWAAALAPDVEVVAIRLPGRESRFRERPYTRLGDVVTALLGQLGSSLDRPYAVLGHSMGALIGYELAQASRRLGLRPPARLLVSGRPAPDLPDRQKPVHDAPTPRLVARLREMGGTPPEILADPAALDSLLPLLRADFAVAETYRYRGAPPLDCPVSVFGGADDPYARPADLEAWRRHTTAGCTVRVLTGGHFFLHEPDARLVPVIRADLDAGHDPAT